MTKDEDKAALEGIVKRMADAQNADQIMECWSKDVVWFDITARFLVGYEAVHAEFAEQFGKLKSVDARIEEMGSFIHGDQGIVYTVQDFHAIPKEGVDINLKTRQTDCFERRSGRWELVHQHISLCLADAIALAT